MGQASAQIPLLLKRTILLDGRGLGRAILLPVLGMARTPFPGAVTTDFAILGIAGELLLPALTTTLLLARLRRARPLLRVKSRGYERPLANAATRLIHPLKIPGLSTRRDKPGLDRLDVESLTFSRKTRLEKNNSLALGVPFGLLAG